MARRGIREFLGQRPVSTTSADSRVFANFPAITRASYCPAQTGVIQCDALRNFPAIFRTRYGPSALGDGRIPRRAQQRTRLERYPDTVWAAHSAGKCRGLSSLSSLAERGLPSLFFVFIGSGQHCEGDFDCLLSESLSLQRANILLKLVHLSKSTPFRDVFMHSQSSESVRLSLAEAFARLNAGQDFDTSSSNRSHLPSLLQHLSEGLIQDP